MKQLLTSGVLHLLTPPNKKNHCYIDFFLILGDSYLLISGIQAA